MTHEYLSIYETEAAYTTAKAGESFDLPHVSLVTATMDVKFDPYVAPVVEEPANNGGEDPGNGNEGGNEFNPENPAEPGLE
jgi:hypothetical protein